MVIRHERSLTKIVATIGPACSDKEILKRLFIEGIDVCRLNFSHGSHYEHQQVIKAIHELNNELGCNVAILADLQGPKLRIGDIENNNIDLEQGDEITLTTRECIGNKKQLFMSYAQFPADVKTGESILIDDGKIKLEVIESDGKESVRTSVVHGGKLSSKKGVNLPDTKISLPSLTEKDIKDALFALDQNIDWIALSFVRSATDIVDLKDLIKKKKKHVRVIAKIEKPEALNEIENIIDLSDGIMIARGDLGVETPFDRVPLIQKEIVNKCINHAKPVIIATQMMESMIHNFRPTRAEANDVANAVVEGADALMLSGETSVGNYPVETIHSMQRIIDWTETRGYEFYREHPPKELSPSFLPDSICYNAAMMARQSKAKAIITFTHSGYTAFRISSHRPNAKIYAFTNNKEILRKLSLLWGVRAFYIKDYAHINDLIIDSIQFLKEQELLHDDDVVIHVGSIPINARGQTNIIKLSYV